MPLSLEKRNRRLYVDLLYQATDMYANFLPASDVNLGDYGLVTKAGEFIKSGNILEDYPTLKDELGEGKLTPEETKHFFVSRSKGTASSMNIAVEIPAIADCSLKLGWNIRKDRHAVLVMIDPNLYELQYEGRLQAFLQTKPELIEKAFVTKVYRCSTYALLITDGHSGQVYVGFKAKTPGPTPTIEFGAAVSQNWQTSSQGWSTGRYDASRHPYSPLATLRQVEAKEPVSGFREGSLPDRCTDTLQMADYIPPWGELDGDGREIDVDKDDDE